MSKLDVEISIESIELNSVLNFRKETQHVAEFKLIYPRPTVASKSATKTLTLVDGTWKGERRTWTERILFKETLNGTSGLEIGITGALTNGELESFLRTTVASLLKTVADYAGDSVALKTLQPFVEIPIDAAAKAIGGTSTPKVMVYAIVDIEEGMWSNLRSGESVTLEVELLTKEAVMKQGRRGTRDGAPNITRKKLLEAGMPVGHAVIRLKG